MDIDIKKRQQTMMVFWFTLLMSVVMLFIVATLAAPENLGNAASATSPLVMLALTALGVLLVIVSFVVKGQLLRKSVEKQDLALVQQGLIIACALCEACALFGVVERFVFGGRGYYALFLIAIIGELLHFPRREQLLAACPEIPISGAV
jgi:hypothetical protein